ncbi:MAG: tetratricopeptide repeat protein, partial [Anaerolineae bacterium]|nr:tetratricopeptide repeat protein [Anaerolineae bacterium]
MAAENEKRSSIFRRSDGYMLVTLVAVALAVLALFVAWRNDRRVRLETGDDVTVEQAEAILERANETTAFADSILSFLEGASVVVGVILAVGAWMLRNGIQRQIEETNAFVAQTEHTFAARERSFQELQETLKHNLETMVAQTEVKIEATRQQAADSFRVLSMLVLAEQQVRAHNIDTATRTLESAYALDPDNQATNYLLGYLFTTQKRFDEAIAHLERALASEPHFAPAVAALGLALRRKGDSLAGEDQRTARSILWSQAETKLLEALDMDFRLTDANGESYFGTLGGLYRRQKRYDEALNAYERARQVTPNSSYPITNLATLHKHQGNDAQAGDYYRRVLRAAELRLDDDPRDYWTRADYAQAKLVLGEPDRALDELRTVIEHAQGRAELESVRSGLHFLTESPTEIDGLYAMLAAL